MEEIQALMIRPKAMRARKRSWYSPLCRHTDSVREVYFQDTKKYLTLCTWCGAVLCEHSFIGDKRIVDERQRWRVTEYDVATCIGCGVTLCKRERTRWKRKRSLFAAHEIVVTLRVEEWEREYDARLKRGYAVTCAPAPRPYACSADTLPYIEADDELTMKIADVYEEGGREAAYAFARILMRISEPAVNFQGENI